MGSAISSCKYKFSRIVRYLGKSSATLRNVGVSIKETWLSDCFGRLAVKTFIGHVSQNYIFSASLWILVFWLFLSQWFEFLAIVLLAVWLRWGEWLTLNFNNGHFVSWWGGNIHTGGGGGGYNIPYNEHIRNIQQHSVFTCNCKGKYTQ